MRRLVRGLGCGGEEREVVEGGYGLALMQHEVCDGIVWAFCVGMGNRACYDGTRLGVLGAYGRPCVAEIMWQRSCMVSQEDWCDDFCHVM